MTKRVPRDIQVEVLDEHGRAVERSLVEHVRETGRDQVIDLGDGTSLHAQPVDGDVELTIHHADPA